MSERRPGWKKLLLASGALLVLGVALFFYLDLHGDVRITFVSASATQPDLVTFSVVNTYRRPVVYYFQGETAETGVWNPWTKGVFVKSSFQYSNYTGRIEGRAAETVTVKFNGTGRWRVAVFYHDNWSMSRLARLKAWLAPYVERVGLQRLSQRLKPTNHFIPVTGPEMLWNQPAPPPAAGAPR